VESLPPRIVIGLTGPVGSGCSTLARFFDDPDKIDREHGNNFLNQLVKHGYVLQCADGLVVNWKTVNGRIAEKLDGHRQAKSKLDSTDEVYPQKGLEVQGKQIFKELGRLLEERESLKTLKFMRPYYPKGKPHLFRTLSMSDVIVFRALVEIDKGRTSKHRKFDSVAKDAIKRIKAGLKEIKPLGMIRVRDFYNKISEPNPPKESIRAFKIIHREVRALKRELTKVTKGKDIEILQQFGNNIRKCGNPFGQGNGNASKEYCVQLAQDMEKVINLIYAAQEAAFFVVDCFRNPYEALYFRQRFPLFYLLSIYADKRIRSQRRFGDLMIEGVAEKDEKAAEEEFNEIDKLDSGEQNNNVQDGIYKQDVTRCVQMSDYAINNLEERPDAEKFLHRKLLRFVSLVLSPGSSKPRKEEVYMNMSYALAVKSNCICRQVGAVIAGEDGYVVGAGWNDVACGEISCGLREVSDMGEKIHEPLFRKVEQQIKKFREHDCFCFKDVMAKNEMTKKIDNILDTKNSEKGIDHLKKVHKSDIHKLVEKAGLHQPEYCLALHAEENAIIQGARIGGPGVIGGTIHTTAQPCTLCAKKIKQAGIVKVIYTDPYPKSEPDIFMNGVELVQFEGVKPRAYIRLFMPNMDQKEWQDLEVCNSLPGFDFNKESYLFEIG